MKNFLKRSYRILPVMLMLMFCITIVTGQRPFITEWVTKYSNTIIIPTHPDEDYDYELVCKRVSDDVEVFNQVGLKASVEIMGLDTSTAYRVFIMGKFPRIYFNNAYNKHDFASLKTIEQWGDAPWTSFENAFSGCEDLDITASDVPDLSGVRSMHHAFSNCINLKGIDANWNWDVSNITDMSFMFYFADLFNSNIRKWDVSKVEDMSNMFSHCSSFKKDISIWDVRKVKSFEKMFFTATSFNCDLGIWTISSAENMQGFFDDSGMNCKNFSMTLRGWAVNPKTRNDITVGCLAMSHSVDTFVLKAIQVLDSKGWELIGIEQGECQIGAVPFTTIWSIGGNDSFMNGYIFIPVKEREFNYDYDIYLEDINNPENNRTILGNKSYTEITSLKGNTDYKVEITGEFPAIDFWSGNRYSNLKAITHWGDIRWNTFYNSFSYSVNMELYAVDVPDLSNVTHMIEMFSNCTSMTGKTANWNWDVSNVISLQWMFEDVKFFNEDITNWDLKSCGGLSGMFSGASSFNQDISVWDVSNVELMDRMFKGASSFNQNISNWDVSKVTYMREMFQDTRDFNQDINGWNVSKVDDMDYMFSNSKSFNQPLNQWNVGNVKKMKGMFSKSEAFNQDLRDWDVQKVTDMTSMFESAKAYNYPLDTWNLHYLVKMNNMLDSCGMDCTEYSKTLIGWSNSDKRSRTLGANRMEYSKNEEVLLARQALLDKGWTILGDKEGNCTVSTENQNELVFDIIPNPAYSDVTLAGLVSNSKVEIVDVTGKIMNSYIVLDDNIYLPLDAYPTGLYFIRVSTPQGINGIKKLVKR